MSIIITGDLHGQFKYLNALINKYKDRLDLVICCGDFGYWPNYGAKYTNIKSQGIKVLWCDGNHENHWELQELNNNEIAKDVFYMPRGSTYKLKDGRNILFMGGANSIDKKYRTIGVDWFPEETIAQQDLMYLPKEKVDIFITHTCPKELLDVMLPYDLEKFNDPSNEALSSLYQMYKPELWFFGHWHHYKEGTMGDFTTKWYALDCVESDTRWWMWMP